jgi:hypothetical protein
MAMFLAESSPLWIVMGLILASWWHPFNRYGFYIGYGHYRLLISDRVYTDLTMQGAQPDHYGIWSCLWAVPGWLAVRMEPVEALRAENKFELFA